MRFAELGPALLRRRLAQGAGIALAVLMGGCVRQTALTYPEGWSQPLSSRGECPHLAGRYVNAGELASGTAPALCSVGRYRRRGEWHCDTSLSRNLADIESGGWMQVRQPDDDTLVIVSSNPTVDVKTLHRSAGDFSCSAGALERRLHASLMSLGTDAAHSSVPLAGYNGLGTAYGAALGTGGVRTLTRRFRTAADGALIMEVSRSESGLTLLIPFHFQDETFVRWRGAASLDTVPQILSPSSPLPHASTP